MTAMWNLNGDDIKKAKEDLETRRAALKAEYEEEVKRIDAELADIDAVERVAVNFVSTRKGDKSPASVTESEPESSVDKELASTDAEKPAETRSETEDKPAGGPVEQKGSRWRMRLGTLSETEAAD
jgi:predicted kinase